MGWIRLIFKVVNIFPSVNEKKKKIARGRKMKTYPENLSSLKRCIKQKPLTNAIQNVNV